jgi:hypothetical protein
MELFRKSLVSHNLLCRFRSTAAHERLLGDNVSDEERQWHEKLLMDRKKMHTKDWRDSEHPGCQLAGHLYVLVSHICMVFGFVAL